MFYSISDRVYGIIDLTVIYLRWAMVIRRRDAEAGADADAETQMTIDFDAEGSSTDAY